MVTKDLTRLKTLLTETEVRLFQWISLERVLTQSGYSKCSILKLENLSASAKKAGCYGGVVEFPGLLFHRGPIPGTLLLLMYPLHSRSSVPNSFWWSLANKWKDDREILVLNYICLLENTVIKNEITLKPSF